ncbi:class I SAM-dependent methyltransferase [Rubellicoccus peritrichatus]|uniref:Class I SAM-dependent methyltransferase n=1 Tax=Rubellicoccus peritrichatus TaxID=3080537 RepID=A0AAQ3L6P6_9BACT|nr:class I SAM-dependent methyltransferase [Puniceicoccus sp. CR14]WOO39672.1 class I SAM-dependent methyltransferase [Puniceicoccus sp. CR14]
MWDQRYKEDGFAYGTEPNSFLAERANLLRSPILSLGEGEGRNAVFLATLSLNVLGVDGSSVGLEKARALARSKGVEIDTELADLSSYNPPENFFNSVVSIFAHLSSDVRQRLYPRVERSLKSGGVLVFEEYAISQLGRDTGGPKDIDLLTTTADLESLFPNCDLILSREIEREVIEGRHHTGLSSVIQFIARKRTEPDSCDNG